MIGLFAQLTDDQRELVLAYQGPEAFGPGHPLTTRKPVMPDFTLSIRCEKDDRTLLNVIQRTRRQSGFGDFETKLYINGEDIAPERAKALFTRALELMDDQDIEETF